ncbi:hypothetical protein [Herbiconiux sp. YIM B11900]|uniref:hypothetical protein n=1 Tax=Herbiconiux sp. YIM B11900 TaxID=3404131 RepID=UPI003F86FFFC
MTDEPRYGERTPDGRSALPAQQPGFLPAGFDEPGRAGAAASAPVGTSLTTRIIAYVLAFALGGLFGILGTIVHQISVSVFGLFDLPLGLVVALPAVALLLVGLRLIAPTRLAALLAAVALVGVVALLALPSPGGSVLIPDSTAGMVWLVGSTLVAVVVLCWPRLGSQGAARRSARGATEPQAPSATK